LDPTWNKGGNTLVPDSTQRTGQHSPRGHNTFHIQSRKFYLLELLNKRSSW